MYLVFDVGGTFVKYAWMSVDGDIQEKGKYPTPTKEGESVPEFVESLGQIYDKYKDQGVEGIALSLPGLIDAENGIIRNGGGIKYLKDAHLAELLGARCDGVKISMEIFTPSQRAPSSSARCASFRYLIPPPFRMIPFSASISPGKERAIPSTP